ncbi:MAG: hypothetical protein RLN86_03985 [Cyclobacteriaceae bacterium]
MIRVILLMTGFVTTLNAFAQLRLENSRFTEGDVESEYLATAIPVYYQKFTSPQLINTSTVRRARYWTSAITSHSYGKGKVGTLYYWDVKGNLSDTQGFIDIAGKNKRGLKLVFPWRQVYYSH